MDKTVSESRLVDLDEGKPITDEPTPEELEAIEKAEAETSKVTETKETKVPEKFKGKSVEEVVEMYRNLESEFGRRNNEVGELRKLTQMWIEKDIQAAQSKPKEDEVDFLENPEAAVDRKVQERLKPIEEKLAKADLAKAEASFTTKYPDYLQTVQSPDFVEWVKASQYRQRLFVAADNRDFDAATELFDTYTERKNLLAEKIAAQESTMKKQQDRAKKDATLESGASGSAAKGKRIYKSADIIYMKMNDPQKYEAMLPEIKLAYIEGRVR